MIDDNVLGVKVLFYPTVGYLSLGVVFKENWYALPLAKWKFDIFNVSMTTSGTAQSLDHANTKSRAERLRSIVTEMQSWAFTTPQYGVESRFCGFTDSFVSIGYQLLLTVPR